jgi:selenide, water dikinase
VKDPNLLIGSATADDAGVYRLNRTQALVQTVDFFTPIVDDPFVYGQIAAANALSDVYAMGGRPLTAMNLVGIPEEKISPEVIYQILKGGAEKVREAGCILLGGHTIRNPEPIYGLSVTGMVSPARLISNAAARPGDLLILTKPLGAGIITTGIKRDLTSPALARRAIHSMRQINFAGADLAERNLVKAGTDVTGFGLLGHLSALCKASRVGAEIAVDKIPVLGKELYALIDKQCIPGGSRDNLELADEFTHWGKATFAQKILLADAQTSGGLLLAVPPRNLEKVRAILKKHRTLSAAIIGRITRKRTPLIEIQ